MKQISKIVAITFFIAFLASCKKDNETNPSSASIVGKWTFSSIGVKTDTKTTEATLAEIKKIDVESAEDLDISFEFKADGTYTSISEGDTENGKYVLDAAKKNITFTSSASVVITHEIVSLSNSEFVLGVIKSSKKDADGEFEFENDEDEFTAYIVAALIYEIRKLDGEAELKKAKSFQMLVKFKK